MAAFHEKLLSIARPVSFRKGARLVRQGQAARGAFLLRQGEVEAQVALPGGGMLALARLGEGEMFGEASLVERGAYSATVVACSEVEGWFVERGDFRAMVAGRDPAALEVQRGIARVLASRLRALNARLLEHPAQEELLLNNMEIPHGSSGAPSFDWRRFLPVLPFFEGFDDPEIDALVEAGAVKDWPRGAPLFAAGQPSSACWVVFRGAVEVFSEAKGRPRRVAVAGPGELVGYLSVIERSAHGAGARVRENACLLEIPAAAFLRFYEGSSGVSVRLQQVVQRSLLKSLARTNTQLTRAIAATQSR